MGQTRLEQGVFEYGELRWYILKENKNRGYARNFDL